MQVRIDISKHVKDFLDVSGNLTVRNQKEDYAWNAYGQLISGPYEGDNVDREHL